MVNIMVYGHIHNLSSAAAFAAFHQLINFIPKYFMITHSMTLIILCILSLVFSYSSYEQNIKWSEIFSVCMVVHICMVREFDLVAFTILWLMVYLYLP